MEISAKTLLNLRWWLNMAKLSQGIPWIVNDLPDDRCKSLELGHPYSKPILSGIMEGRSGICILQYGVDGARRISELQAISINAPYTTILDDRVVIRPDPAFIPKVATIFHRSQEMILSSFFANPTFEEEKAFHCLDVRRYLLHYLSRTKGSKPPEGLHTHFTRTISTSLAEKAVATIEDICKAAAWSSPSTFLNHYRLQLNSPSDLSFGSKVLSAILSHLRSSLVLALLVLSWVRGKMKITLIDGTGGGRWQCSEGGQAALSLVIKNNVCLLEYFSFFFLASTSQRIVTSVEKISKNVRIRTRRKTKASKKASQNSRTALLPHQHHHLLGPGHRGPLSHRGEVKNRIDQDRQQEPSTRSARQDPQVRSRVRGKGHGSRGRVSRVSPGEDREFVVPCIDNELLIQLVEARHGLWDHTDCHHADHHPTQRLWRQISECLFSGWEDLSAADQKECVDKVTTRWWSMRDRFKRDYNKEVQAPSGSRATSGSTYVYSAALEFLRTVVAKSFENETNISFHRVCF
ncbi:uncharacterized protein LOC122927188 [Bufo gargarizans]|uniref:uncharacterized protein LOC122927188 n=1 Tax=Bufo gargarizans TaxID=30331 RepID=UPI001CF4945B|nr:uncharacterized protein LOC122927188 [Bufo gargarizans]